MQKINLNTQKRFSMGKMVEKKTFKKWQIRHFAKATTSQNGQF